LEYKFGKLEDVGLSLLTCSDFLSLRFWAFETRSWPSESEMDAKQFLVSSTLILLFLFAV